MACKRSSTESKAGSGFFPLDVPVPLPVAVNANDGAEFLLLPRYPYRVLQPDLSHPILV